MPKQHIDNNIERKTFESLVMIKENIKYGLPL